MANVTIFFASLLILLGAAGFVATGSHAPTALIPAFFGIVLLIIGLLARTRDPKRRMLLMHIAVALGLLGFLGTVSSFAGLVRIVHGEVVARPAAVVEKSAMAILTLIYVLLCVRSFIAARRARV
jgi:hypothetical protein